MEINEPLLRTSRVDEIAKWKVVCSMLDVSEWTGYVLYVCVIEVNIQSIKVAPLMISAIGIPP